MMLVPSLAVVALVAIYPLGLTVWQSFTNEQFLAGLQPVEFVGLDNYRACSTTRSSAMPSWLTIKFTVITVAFELVLGLIIALVVNSGFKGRGVMRAVMLVPWAIPTVVAAQMWKWMYNDIFGVINDALIRIHVVDKASPGSPSRARHSPRCARSTSGRRRHSSRSCFSRGCR